MECDLEINALDRLYLQLKRAHIVRSNDSLANLSFSIVYRMVAVQLIVSSYVLLG